jgi:hypothetical protein
MGTVSQRLRVSRVLLSGSLICALAVPAFAGDGTGKPADASSPNANAANPTPATSSKPDREKKIYTNEDVDALARNYGASNVGNATPAISSAPAAEQQPPRRVLVTRFSPAPPPLPLEKEPVFYAQQYASLTARLSDIDAQLVRLRGFRMSDAAPGSIPGVTYGLNIYAPCEQISTDDLIRRLELQRSELAAQVSDIEDRARMNDIPAAVLRDASQVVVASMSPRARLLATREDLNRLQGDLAEVSDTQLAMQQQAAAQNITLIPESKYGGGFTADYMQQLDIAKSSIQQQITSVEDTAQREGISPNTLP